VRGGDEAGGGCGEGGDSAVDDGAEIVERAVGAQLAFDVIQIVGQRCSCATGLARNCGAERMPYLPVQLPFASIMPAACNAFVSIWYRPSAPLCGLRSLYPKFGLSASPSAIASLLRKSAFGKRSQTRPLPGRAIGDHWH